MTSPFLTPLDLPTDGLEHEEQAFGFLEPLAGFGVFVLVVVLLVATLLYLQRRGSLPPLGRWRQPPAPELAAKQVLAERLAQGDLSPEEFLERASILNWTPGSETSPPRRVGRHH
jgi:putative membrane protein